jgi:hypothetical protein
MPNKGVCPYIFSSIQYIIVIPFSSHEAGNSTDAPISHRESNRELASRNYSSLMAAQYTPPRSLAGPKHSGKCLQIDQNFDVSDCDGIASSRETGHQSDASSGLSDPPTSDDESSGLSDPPPSDNEPGKAEEGRGPKRRRPPGANTDYSRRTTEHRAKVDDSVAVSSLCQPCFDAIPRNSKN